MDVHDEFVPESEFATCLRHTPQPCVDLVVTGGDGEGVLLARRQKAPAAGEWFWPGSRLYKGERLDDAPARIADEELGLTVASQERLGVSEHFWAESAVPGVDARHTVVVVYRVDPVESVDAVTLDDQHDAARLVSDPAGHHEYVQEYFERFL